jgi:lipopolysaccharide transport system permease protein
MPQSFGHSALTVEEIVIEPGRSLKNYWLDLWRYRELFIILAWRDIAVRYKQTAIGIAWALLRPFLTMVVFTIVFSKVAKLPSPGSVPYPLLVFAAMLPWQFVSTALSEASSSLISNSSLISKVFFPRLIIPSGAVITSFIDFLITVFMMAGLMLWYGFAPDWRVLVSPLFVGLGFAAAFGAGLWLSALNVEYRDFRYVVPFLVQFGLYISPVGFSSDLVPERWHWLYDMNPMVAIIDGFRWSLLRGETAIRPSSLILCLVITTVLCISGLKYFRRVERVFADII